MKEDVSLKLVLTKENVFDVGLTRINFLLNYMYSNGDKDFKNNKTMFTLAKYEMGRIIYLMDTTIKEVKMLNRKRKGLSRKILPYSSIMDFAKKEGLLSFYPLFIQCLNMKKKKSIVVFDANNKSIVSNSIEQRKMEA